MAVNKPRPMLADYVVIALSPALIIALEVSLVFFLIAVCYGGAFVGRLNWGMFWFTFGIVLVARISMEYGIEDRAKLYGSVLAFLGWFSMGRFVDYPAGLEGMSWVVNAGLVALVWWTSYKLVYDCTYIDEKAEAIGTGVLQAAGLEEGAPGDAAEEDEEEEAYAGKPKPDWWQRYQEYRAAHKKAPTPGVWVVYYSLAALPIFGLGQALIPAEEIGQRRYVFWLMAAYGASALGLLVTTSFLGLRRYLRQRGIPMPKALAGAWLGSGALLTFAFLTVGALLPRPNAEYSLLSFTPAGSKDRDASQYALKDGDPGKGDGRAGAQQMDEKKGAPVNSDQKDKQGGGGKGQAKGQGQGENKGQQKGGDAKGKGDKSGDGKKGESKDDASKRDAKDEGKDDRDGNDNKSDPGNNQQARDPKSGKTSGSTSSRKSSSSSWSPPAFVGKTAGVLKWVVFAVLAAVAVVFVLRGGLRYLANFFDWARQLLEALRALWESLFGGGRRAGRAATGEAEGESEERRPRRPFRAFTNPFLDGRGDDMTPAELARYSFEALEAWAYERDLGRRPQETPIEFADRVGGDVPALDADGRHLAALYARVLYAKGGLPSTWRGTLEKFWERIEAVAEQPLSA